MDLNKATEAITAWQEENDNHRSVLVIAIEESEPNNGAQQTNARVCVQGNKESMTRLMKHLLKTGESFEMQDILLHTFLESYVDMINDQKKQTNNNNEKKEEE